MRRSVPQFLSARSMRFLAAAVALVFLSLAFAPAAYAASKPKEVDVDDVMQSISVNLFKIDSLNAKLTLKGVAGAIEKLKAYGDYDENTFRYSVVFHGKTDIELLGSFYYKKSEKKPYLNMSSFLKWKNTKYDSRNFYLGEDCINWTVKLPGRASQSFDFNDVTSVDVTFRNPLRVNCKASKAFEDPLSDVILETNLKGGGTLKVQPVDGTTLRVYIGDPDLMTGYPISPDGKGTKTPVWYVKAVANSYLWVEMTVDGRNASSMNDMAVTAGEFHLLKYESNKYHPKSFALDTGSCRIEDGQLVLELLAPTQDFHYLKWIEISMDDGADVSRYVIAH